MLLITLEYPQAQMSGTAVFRAPRRGGAALFAALSKSAKLARQDILASEERLRSLGVTSLFEVCYYLVRQ